MIIWLRSNDGKYYYSLENPTIRADLNKNVYGGGWFSKFTDFLSEPAEEIGSWVEETFLPESVKSAVEDIPVVGDIVSRGWLGPMVQQMTNEGQQAEVSSPTSDTIQSVTAAVTLAAMAAVLGGGLGAAGFTLPGFGAGGMFSGGAGAIGGTGASAGGWAEALAPYTGMTGSTAASTAPSWLSSLGTTLGTTGATGGAMNFADLLSRVTGQNTSTGGFDWATLTGQGGAQGSMPLDLYAGGGSVLGDLISGSTATGGGMDWLINLVKGATGTGGEGGWGTTGKVAGKVLGRVLGGGDGGGGGGGGGQPTGRGGDGETGIDWLDALLNIILGKEGGSGGLLGTAATAWGGLETGKEAQRQRDWLERLYAPQQEYQKEQLGLFKDVFSPLTKRLGGELGDMFSTDTSALSNAYWSKGRGKIEDYYKDIEQQASERFAGAGMLGQGPAMEYFGETLPGMKAKSMEDLVVDQVLTDYGFKQQGVSNMLSFLGKTPSVAGYDKAPSYVSTNINWGNLLKDIVSPAQSPIMV